MQIKIYADVVLCINLFMDFFIFWILSRLVRKKVPFWRLLLGSGSMAVLYCALLFFPRLHRYYNFFGALVILSLGVWIAFRPRTAGEFLKLLLFAHISAFAVGGTGMALFYFTSIGKTVGTYLTFSIGNFSWKLLLSSTAMIYILLKLSSGWLNTHVVNRKNFCTLRITLGEKQVQVTTLLDTGNSLKDPLTGDSVIVAEFQSISGFFPAEVRKLFYEETAVSPEALLEKLRGHPLCARIRMVPFQSLGTPNGILIGFKPDRAELVDGKQPVAVPKVLIGVYNGLLCKNMGYHALMNPGILEPEGL